MDSRAHRKNVKKAYSVEKGPAQVKGTDVLQIGREGQSQPEILVAMMVEIHQPRKVSWGQEGHDPCHQTI